MMSDICFKTIWEINVTNGLESVIELIPPLLGIPILLELSEHTEPAANLQLLLLGGRLWKTSLQKRT